MKAFVIPLLLIPFIAHAGPLDDYVRSQNGGTSPFIAQGPEAFQHPKQKGPDMSEWFIMNQAYEGAAANPYNPPTVILHGDAVDYSRFKIIDSLRSGPKPNIIYDIHAGDK